MNDMEGLLKKTAITAGITAIIYLVLFYFVDKPIDIWVHNHLAKTFIFQLGTYNSLLAKGAIIKLAIAICFVLIIILDHCLTRLWTRHLLYICITASIAIIIGEGFKYLLGRYRPIMLFEHNLYGMHFFSSEWALNSTPSGHTIRAFSILTAASFLYRRFTIVFISIATLIGASRVIVTAHYPSDVLFGAFIGIFTAAWTYAYFFNKTTTPPPGTSRPG
jgi:membrane-associated phospholipid phosphatase